MKPQICLPVTLVLLGCADPAPAPAAAPPPRPERPADPPPERPAPAHDDAKAQTRIKALQAEVRRLRATVLTLKGDHASERGEHHRAAAFLSAALETEPTPPRRARALAALSRAWGVTRLGGFGAAVGVARWSPSGKQLAVGSADGAARLYDPTGALIAKLIGHGKAITGLAWAPSGSWVATSSQDTTVRLFSAAGKPGAVLKGHKAKVTAVAWSPAGNRIASAADDGEVRLWLPTDPKPLKPLTGHTRAVRALAWSPDGKQLASASDDNTVRLWKPTGAAGSVLKGHAKGVRCAAWSPDGKLLATGSKDRTIRVWSAADGSTLRTLSGHRRAVTALRWSRDGLLLASSSEDGTIVLWNRQTGARLATARGHTDFVVDVDVTTGPVLAGASWDGTVGLLRASGEKSLDRLLRLRGHTDQVLAVAWSPDGRVLASTSADKTVRLWRFGLGPRRARATLDSPPTACARVGDRLAIAQGKTIALRSVERLAPAGALPGHPAPVTCLAASADGKLLASGAQDATLLVWNAAARTLRTTLRGHAKAITAAAFAPTGAFASGSADGSVRVWDLASGKARVINNPASVWALAWSPDGQRLAAAGKDGKIHLWSPDGRPLGELPGHVGGVHALGYAPDGKLLASAGEDKQVRLWAGTTQLAALSGHTEAVHALAWSPDGRHLAAGAWDRTVRLWEVHAKKTAEAVLPERGLVAGLAWTPDGLLSVSDAKRVTRWDAALLTASPAQLRAAVAARTGLRVQGLELDR